MTTAIASFFLVALMITIAPGPDSALVLRTSLARGRMQGIATAFGTSLGLLLWATASALGISALLTASTVAYDVLRLAGAAYLCWLGAQAICAAVTGRHEGEQPRDAPLRGRVAAFRTGLLSNLLNPKIAVFYITVLPQFVPRGVPVLAASLVLAAVHVAMGMAWLTFVAWAADRAKALLRKDSARRTIEGVTGVVLIGFGVRTALADR